MVPVGLPWRKDKKEKKQRKMKKEKNNTMLETEKEMTQAGWEGDTMKRKKKTRDDDGGVQLLVLVLLWLSCEDQQKERTAWPVEGQLEDDDVYGEDHFQGSRKKEMTKLKNRDYD